MDEVIEFPVYNPYFALLRFLVQDEDVFGDPNFIGQATYPLSTYILFPNYIKRIELFILHSFIYENDS